MKTKNFFINTALMAVLIMAGCKENPDPLTLEKSVSVAAQSGVMTAKTAGSSVTFAVVTANIADGEYDAVVANLPAGVTAPDKLSIASSKGTLTLTGSASAEAGAYTALTLTIDKTVSKAFTLIVSAETAKSLSVAEQNSVMTAKTAGSSVTFAVVTANIADGEYDAVVANLPEGVTASDKVSIASSKGTLTLTGSAAAEAGEYSTLQLAIDGVQSAAFTLTITAMFEGAGTETDPYKIGSAVQLAQLATLVNANTKPYANINTYYRQTAEIDLSAYSNWTPIGDFNTNNDLSSFRGSYDGNGHSISNLSINRPESDHQGLFGQVRHTNSVINNVRLTNVNITGKNRVGGVAGILLFGKIENCCVSVGAISGGSNVGGVIGDGYGGRVEKCFVTGGAVTGSGSGGGIAGNIFQTSVFDCYATVNVSGDIAGGVVGQSNSSIRYCYATGNVSGIASSYVRVGGIVGYSDGNVRYCVALNKLVSINISSTYIGRVAGANSGTMDRCYARNDMILSYVTPDSNPSDKHGGNISATDYNGSTWWSSSSGAPGFSTSIWSLANGRLPWLLGFSGYTQNPTVTP